MTSLSSNPLPHRSTTTTLTTMMMIRSTHIPIILNRICDDRHILSALLVTADGELLGSAAAMAGTAATTTRRLPSPESLGTLLADIAWDYHRLGDELATLLVRDEPNSNAAVPSKMECLFMELEEGMVGISSCCMTSTSCSSSSSSSSSDSSHAVGCFVMVICTPDAPLGWVRQRLQTVTNHIQDSLSLTSSSILTTTTTANSNNHNHNIDHQNTLTGS